ncbi:M3 family metallopeptidase [Terriglobus sp. TAA 43]|uniref:M3 family metallopeptidase n=1 Tax=Terriglobus sp. TAA 43 TaxID=278961 RepID=UPI00064654C6|nr:M3 family metallopeptidase [Terriglobus sp. TAA 43]
MTDKQGSEAISASTDVFDSSNPFFSASTLPFYAPPFDLIRDEHYMPAFEAGMAQARSEVDAIIANAEGPSFQNTIVELEKTGELLNRVAHAFYAVSGAHTNPTLQQLQQEVAPRLAAHSDSINLDERLFSRVKAVYDQRESLSLDAESLRLLELTYDGFVKSGALLSDPDKNTLKALNQEQSTLQAKFINCVLAAMKEGGLQVASREELDGLSDAEITEAAEAAKSRELEGFYLTLQNTTQQPALASLKNRETRQALWQASLSRAEKGNTSDTREMIARLAQLRAQRARMLSYENYAAWKLSDQMARTPHAAIAFLDNLVPAALAGANAEAAAMQELIGSEFTLEPWDWAFYAELVRKAKYDINEDEVKQYFDLNRVFEDGVLFAATQLYGITFAKRTDLPVYHPDVVTYEVFNADGSHLSLLYCDFYRRDSKRGGAWMSSLLTQSKLLGYAPIITNVCNYTKPVDGQPSLIDSDEVNTLFHEFGHALHGMLSDVTYPSLSGTSVPRDFVEFPSQFNEHWASYPAVFANYAKHWKTGEAMPEQLQAKLKATKNFNGGHALTEVLAAAEVDLQWHTLPSSECAQQADVFEAKALAEKGVDFALVPPRYRSTYFAHIFGGGYAAGYYAYLWAEMLDSDAYHWFEQNGGLTRANGDRLRNMVLSRGNTADPAELYREWAGRDPEIGPMLQQRGIPDSAAAAE